MKRGYCLVNWCYMCRSGETVTHMFHFDFAHDQWAFVFSMFGVHQVVLWSVVDLLSGWRNWFGKHICLVFNPAMLELDIVRERNHCTFKVIEISVVPLKSYFFSTLFSWSCVLGPSNFDNFVDFH
jgi:hypothetical protein